MINTSILKLCVLSSLILTSTTSFADLSGLNIVYGEDNRLEPYEASYTRKSIGKSTAAMVKKLKMVDLGEHIMLPPKTIASSINLCENEKFYDQPSSSVCSGFLIGPDVLVTAGHCVKNEEDCENFAWVFDYEVKNDSKRVDIITPKKNIYSCKKLVESKLEGSKENSRDYAVIKLDRVVQNRAPLNYRKKGSLQKGNEIYVIGYPSGLPQKIAGGAEVTTNTSKHFFEANLDTFGGNSGSAVFNSSTNLVEGILVRGATDYKRDEQNKCTAVNRVDADIEGKATLGESVSRITDIDVLKKKDRLFSLLKTRSNKEIEELFVQLLDTEILYDSKMNTPIHILAKTSNRTLLKSLIDLGADIDALNVYGESALHIAAKKRNRKALKILIANGANPMIKDNFGRTALERTNRFDRMSKSLLRKAVRNFKRRR